MSEHPSISTAWRIYLNIFGGIVILVFLGGIYLTNGFIVQPREHISVELKLLIISFLLLPPLYWLLFITGRKRLWARYVMLVIGLMVVLLTITFLASIFLTLASGQ
jgi:hypothetical protein